MPATVKSLEERIDEMAYEFSAMRTQLAVVLNGQSTIQIQLASALNDDAAMRAQTAVLLAKLDSVVEDLKSTRSQLDATNTRLDSPEIGLSVLGSRLATTVAETKSIAEKVDAHRVEFAAFRGKADATLGLIKWVGATATIAMISVIIASFSVARSAGNIQATVEQHQKVLDEIRSKQK